MIRKHRLEPEPVGQIGLALGNIVVEGDMNVICDAVVEAKSIRTDARLLERKNRKSGGQKLLTEAFWLTNAYTSVVLAAGSSVTSGASMWLDARAGVIAAMLAKKIAPEGALIGGPSLRAMVGLRQVANDVCQDDILY